MGCEDYEAAALSLLLCFPLGHAAAMYERSLDLKTLYSFKPYLNPE